MSLLTIKHVEKSGHESIQQAHSVSYEAKGYGIAAGGTQLDVVKEPDKAMLIAFGCTGVGGAVDENGVCRYGSGVVYVMNDAGSTVGKYDLD